VGVRAKVFSLRPFDSWDCGFESQWGHGCGSYVFVECCVGSDICKSW